MGFAATAAGIVFILTYVLIMSDRVDRTISALAGGLLTIILQSISQHQAFMAIDLNVIFLLLGMMIIAGIMSETGIFQWLAIRAVQMGKGDPVRIMVVLALITAVTSALLDNVTMIVLIAPVAIFVATSLGLSPLPFLITSLMASNIGGAATLIGDPPNILIGSAAGINFVSFLVNMGPPVLVILLLYIPLMKYQFGEQLMIDPKRSEAMHHLSTDGVITNPLLMKRSLFVLGLVLVAFLLEPVIRLEAATIAMAGATVLMLIGPFQPAKALEKVEWSTLLFFIGLFVMVESVVHTGWIEQAAGGLLEVTGGNVRVSTHLILLLSTVVSGIVDNIPYTTTMMPLIESLSGSMDITPLWWALAMGADFGGNLTLIGASANIVAVNLAATAGHRIGFRQFLLYGIPTVFVSLLVSVIWLELRFV